MRLKSHTFLKFHILLKLRILRFHKILECSHTFKISHDIKKKHIHNFIIHHIKSKRIGPLTQKAQTDDLASDIANQRWRSETSSNPESRRTTFPQHPLSGHCRALVASRCRGLAVSLAFELRPETFRRKITQEIIVS